MITPDLWPKLSEVARLRIENKLLIGIRAGEILPDGTVLQPLATWSHSFLKVFSLREQAAVILISKLEDTDQDDRWFVARYFLPVLPEIVTKESDLLRIVVAIASAIRNGDQHVREAAIGAIRGFPGKWQRQLAQATLDLADSENPAVVLSDGTPFLSAPAVEENDDIPF